MSIEVTGPQKYEFQDLLCVVLWLRFRHLRKLRLFIEPLGKEDAFFCFSNNGTISRLEVQAKGASGAVDLNAVAGCLAHFPPHADKNSLFERLMAETNTFVLLVMTGRCTDAAARFAMSGPWLAISPRPTLMPPNEAKALLKEFARQYHDADSKLNLKRKKRCKELSRTTSVSNLRRSAARLGIEERVTEELVRSECESRLKTEFLVPNDRLQDAINALAATVRNTKYESRQARKLIDASPRLLSTAREFARSSIQPVDYVRRGTAEDHWRAALSQEGTLLLSGPPRCGKSYASLYVAAKFQTLGYDVKQGTDVEDASRFLLDVTAGNRIYVLDDPLGALQPTSDAFRAFERLRWLIPRLPANRRLIVAQSQDQLFEVLGKTALHECAIANVKWHDLSSVPSGFLADAWQSMANEVARREDVEAIVEPALREGAVEIELGCLRHLASTLDELPANPDLEQIVQHARQDAKNLGLSLARSGPDMTQFLLALAVGSAPGKALRVQELAFLLDRNSATLPGKSAGAGTYFGGKVKTEEFPSYPYLYTLPTSIEHQMDTLERRRFITVHGDLVQFAHPFYRAAAQNLLNAPTGPMAKEAVRLFERAVFCLSPLTATAAVQNAEWLFHALKSRPEELLQILGHAEEALESIFPNVRDQCFEFLLRHLNDLNPEQKADRAHWVASALSVSLDDVNWHEGHAWVPSHKNFLESWESELEKPAEAEIRADLQQLEAGKSSNVQPARAARVLKYYSHHPESLSLNIAKTLLGYEEALIRARTAREWFMVERIGDSELIERIFQDTHPAVILASFKRCARSWRHFSLQRQTVLKARLEEAANSEVIAVALLPSLVVFDREEYFGKNPPWDLFQAVMSQVFSALPERARFVDARLYSVMKTALSNCAPAALARICYSWLEWLKREAAIRYLDEYSLSVADILIRATRRDPDLRGHFIQDLLSLDASDILIYVLRDLLDLWKDLQEHERKLVLNLLNSGRPDEKWLRAVALTRRTVPDEIQELILGSENSLDAAPATLASDLPMPLLSAAIAVQCGKPGVFWNLAHSSKKFDEVVRLIEKQPSHPAFEAAFHEAVLSMDDMRVAAIVESAKLDELEKVFWLLLRQRVEWTGNFLPKTWESLLGRADQEIRRVWLGHMAAAAPACIDNLAEIGKWLIRKEDQHLMLELLYGDTTVAVLSRELVNANESREEYIIEKLRGALKEEAPRLFGTCDSLRAALKRAGIHLNDVSEQITSVRERAFAERRTVQEKFREPDPVPVDWVETAFRMQCSRSPELVMKDSS